MNEDQESKTEEATPKRLEELREKGSGARSADVGSAVALGALAASLAVMGDYLAQEVVRFTVRALRLSDVHRPLEALVGALPMLMLAAVPLLAVSVLCGAAGFAQSRTFSIKLAGFDPERLDPAKALKQLIPNTTQLLEILKQVLKLGAIGWLAYSLIADEMPQFSVLGTTSPTATAGYIAGVSGKLFLRIAIAFAAVAGFDYFMAHRKFNKEAMMTLNEVKDERKSEEGRPEVRMRIRRRMRDLLQSRKMGDIKTATVVVTNPTHYAVALRYLPDEDFAPLIVAKAKDANALRLRTEARRHEIPIIENKPLARALYAQGKVGRAIPVDLYRGTAEVIAFVMQLSASRRAVPARKPAPSPEGADA